MNSWHDTDCPCADCSAVRKGEMSPAQVQSLREKAISELAAAGPGGLAWSSLTFELRVRPFQRPTLRRIMDAMERAQMVRSEPIGSAAGKPGRPGIRYFWLDLPDPDADHI